MHNKKAPDYLKDEHLSTGTKKYLRLLNASEKPVESLSVPEARNVLVNAQASIPTGLSGIEESEKVITVDDQMLFLNILRPEGHTGKLPVFIFIHGGVPSSFSPQQCSGNIWNNVLKQSDANTPCPCAT